MTPSDDHGVREEATAAALTPWQAALLLGVHLLFWVLGTPGLDLMTTMQYLTPQNREKLSQQVPAPVATAIFDLAMFNRAVRLPVVELFAPIQKPFRIAQSWHLYKDGPAKLQRLEIFVDDQLVHRSVDPGHAWLEPQLRYRRVRPMVESTVTKRLSWTSAF
ncbi:MAG TPA: hypothetical protein PKC57_12760, partial [Microthrixaceae bacterium]|nr:hypothetical protein [Microthrixaceae bacterium]